MTDQIVQRDSAETADPGVIQEILDKNPELNAIGAYQYGWADSDAAGEKAVRGLNEDVVRDISGKKDEPEWMRDLRLKALKYFERKPMPAWGPDLSGIDFDNIKYFVRSTEKQATSWDELPEDIKNTYDKLGIPEAERGRVFDLFHRAVQGDGQPAGTGLGLAIVKGMVEANGGTVAVIAPPDIRPAATSRGRSAGCTPARANRSSTPAWARASVRAIQPSSAHLTRAGYWATPARATPSPMTSSSPAERMFARYCAGMRISSMAGKTSSGSGSPSSTKMSLMTRPEVASTSASATESAVCATPSASAAADRLPLAATVTKVSICLKRSMGSEAATPQRKTCGTARESGRCASD